MARLVGKNFTITPDAEFARIKSELELAQTAIEQAEQALEQAQQALNEYENQQYENDPNYDPDAPEVEVNWLSDLVDKLGFSFLFMIFTGQHLLKGF